MARVQEHFLAFNKAIKDDQPQGMREASLALYDLTRELIADREAAPLDPAVDPATALLQARPGGEALPREMVVGTLRQVLLVGIVAPRFVLGSFAVHLARDASLQDQLRAEPGAHPQRGRRAAAAVLALPRLRPHRQPRRRDRRLSHRQGRGDRHGVHLGQPGREVFEDPDSFRFGRPARHIAFRPRAASLPGAIWARMELRVALEELLARTARFELAGPVEMTRWPEFGPESVPLTLRARS